MSLSATQLALLSFEGVHLLVPQFAVATIETAGSIDRNSNGDGSVGMLRAMGGEWPVFALAADFQLRQECPASYKYCVAMNYDNRAAFSLACEQVGTVLVTNPGDFQPIQDCMRGVTSPIESLLLKDNKLMLLTNIGFLQKYLQPEAAA